ncbi:MAG: pyridoxamine 5'-phosphate oxidase family protein [Peptococcaceae bacterium]|jgi:general stress protein 26|nr:pyridoxamine 5'-phosphate oxidase family protein [Peptococcaceae bacterium]
MPDQKEISAYLNEAKHVILATVDAQNKPVLRTMGSFAADGLTVYCSTHRGTDKLTHIQKNPAVIAYFQHEGQNPAAFKNVSVAGKAVALETEADIQYAVRVLSDHLPRFKERADKGEIAHTVFLRIEAQEVKIVDFSKGKGPQAVEILRVN